MTARSVRDFLRGGWRSYQYPTYNQRLCARYGYELNSAYSGPTLDVDRDRPASWGELHKRAVARAETFLAEQGQPVPDEAPPDSTQYPADEATQQTLPDEWMPRAH